jgi:hypothetical protein
VTTTSPPKKRWHRFEHRREPMLPRSLFFRRVLRYGLVSLAFVVASLGIGMIGYHATEGLSWLDAFLNASMILTGMGPVNEMRTTAGKLFAACYALFSGVAFLTAVAVLFAPLFHRFLHRFHLDIEAEAGGKR